MFLLYLLPTVMSLGYDQIGLIKPSGILPVSNSITNVGHYADYTFTFNLTNDLPSGGVLSIEFPTQFENNLGIAGNPSCSVLSCVLSGNTVKLTVSKVFPANSESSVTIKSIKNPGKAGGTGNFKLKTFYSDYIIDMNLVFGSVGISDSPSELALVTVQVLPGSSEIAGDISKYLFTFQSSADIPAGSWILFTFPDSGIYLPANPSCSSFASSGLNVEGDLQCTTEGLQIKLTGISKVLFSGFQYNIRMTGTNPRWSASLGYFSVRVFRENTNTLLTFKENIKGFSIKTADFLELSLTSYEKGIELSKNSIVLYKLHIRAKNPVEERGFIIVDFPPTFTVDGDYLVWVESGLKDFNYNDKVLVEYSIPMLRLTISNFQTIPAEQNIDIILQLKNPSYSGPSECLTVYSLRPDGFTVIDLNSTGAFIKVSEYSSPSLSITYPSPNLAGGVNIVLNFQLVPNLKVPAEGFVVLRFPASFSTSPLVCKVTPYGSGTDSAKSCSVTNNEIWVQLFISTLNPPSGPGDFVVGQQSSVSVTLLSPLQSGYYFFSVSTFSNTKVMLETGGVMAFIDASGFDSISVQPASTGINSPCVLMVKLKAAAEIPSGIASKDFLGTRGYLEIRLPTQDDSGNYLFDLDLGLGLVQGQSVSCKGVQIITGLDTSQLTCTVTSKPTVPSIGTPVVITVTDFYTIPAGVSFELHLAGLKYLLTSNPGIITVQAYSMTNRLKTLIHSGTSTIPAGLSLPAFRDFSASSDILVLTAEIQELNELSVIFNTLSTISATNSYLLLEINPTHDSGYCSSLDIQCEVSGISKCYCYSGADLLLIYLPNGLTINTFNLLISGLFNPESVSTTSDQIWLYLIDDSAIVDYIKLGNLPSLVPGSMTHTAFFKDQTCAGCVNVGYEFFMRVLNQIPAEGSLVITLDPSKSYSLHYSSPKPYCSYFSVNGIEVLSYKCTPYRNILTLSALPFIESGSLIRVLLQGVKNPSSIGSLGTIKYESKNKQGRVINLATVSAGFLDSMLEVEDVETALISNFPKNEGASAEYSIFFSPISSIGPGASIEIDFPTKNFEQFINPPNCRVSIGISFIKDCLFYGKTFRAVVNSEYHNSQITVHVLDILNFPAGNSESFQIRVIYDGTVLQRSTSSITVSTVSAAKSISTTLIHFYPKNEAETATYEFHINPSQGFNSSFALTVAFPGTFDKRLGDGIKCWAIGLKGYIKCAVVRSWTLQVTDHDDFILCESCFITLFVWGVINPNYEKSSNTGQFKVGIESSEHYSMLNEKAGELGMIQAGGVLSLWSTSTNNLYARTINDFSFNISTSYSIPSSVNLGAIWVEFPSDYILKGSEVWCSSSLHWSSGVPKCRIEFNTVQLLSSSGKTAGDFELTIKNLCNPLFDVKAGYINLKIFDGYNNQIIARSYPNLSKNQLKFEYPGPLIHVNNDKTFTVERGTVSEYIKVSFDYPCALNLTLQPYTFGFVFIPTDLVLSVGDMEGYFRVSASPTVEDTLYVISWKVSGEVSPTYYTPITKSLFQVVKTGKVRVSFEAIPSIPKGGSSIPVQISLKYSPYNNINLLFSVSTMYSGLSILPQKMEFRAGHTQGFYKIFISNSTQATSSFVTVSLSGDDSSVFDLALNEISFSILTDDQVQPDVTSIAVTQLRRASASIVLTTAKVSTVFYAFALFGTLQPSFDELTQGGPPSYDTSDIQYGTLYVSSSCVKNLTLTGLSAGTSYTVFAIAVDQRGVYSEIARTANFSTLPIHSPAVVGLWFTQTYLTSVEKDIIRGTVALVLGLNLWQVIESEVKASRQLASSSDQVVTFFQVYLIDNPRSDDYPKPKDLIQLLQAQKDYLVASLPNFNKSAGIEGQEVVLSPCSWHQLPYLLGTSDYRSISLAGSLLEAGYLFGVAVPASNDTGTPLGFQVASGLDAANRVTRADRAKVALKTLGNLTFTDLAPDVHYNVYVVCGNLIPGFPEVSQDVKFIRWKTDTSPAADLLDVDFSFFAVFSGILMILF